MKKTIITIWFAIMACSLYAQATKTIVLNPPDTNRGIPAINFTFIV